MPRFFARNLKIHRFAANKAMDIFVLGALQLFVRPAENYFAAAEHHNLGIDEAELFAFLLENDFTVFAHGRVFRTDIFEILHLVRHEDRGNVF